MRCARHRERFVVVVAACFERSIGNKHDVAQTPCSFAVPALVAFSPE